MVAMVWVLLSISIHSSFTQSAVISFSILSGGPSLISPSYFSLPPIPPYYFQTVSLHLPPPLHILWVWSSFLGSVSLSLVFLITSFLFHGRRRSLRQAENMQQAETIRAAIKAELAAKHELGAEFGNTGWLETELKCQR